MTMLYFLLPYGSICSLIRLFYKISYIFMIRKIVRKCAIPRIRPLDSGHVEEISPHRRNPKRHVAHQYPLSNNAKHDQTRESLNGALLQGPDEGNKHLAVLMRCFIG